MTFSPPIRRHRHHASRCAALLVSAAGAVFALGACSGADVGSEAQHATDSFAHPTEHGELMFGAPNHASFDESHRFHSWTFALSGEATLTLKTELLAHNLDTVMYLYRRDPGAQEWGSNIASNDDHDGQMWSQIDGSFGPGEYRVKVKAAKTTFAGDFAVLAGCDGAGCPAASGGTCSPEHPADLPPKTDFTVGCPAVFNGVLLAPVENQWSTSVSYADRCELGGWIAKAIDYYRDYWDHVGYWEDLVDGEDPQMNVEVVEHGDAGKVIAVDVGADEDVVEFVFDGYGQLVMYFHHASYSEEAWFCGKPGEEAADEPASYSEDCAGYALASLQHEAGTEQTGQGTTSLGSPDAGLPEFLRQTANRFSEEVALEHEDDPIAYSYVMWPSIDGDQAAELTLSAHGTTVSYLVGETYGDGGYIYMAIHDGVARFVCDEGYY